MSRKLKITQVRSTMRCKYDQEQTLHALGIRKMQQSVEHDDTPQIRGMIRKIVHLLKVEEV
ncbi:MAG: 50S ribosomal protein L30 [Candidatus Eiseniibacteriota bacterium]|jgi:large subunit ribosomal protein L30